MQGLLQGKEYLVDSALGGKEGLERIKNEKNGKYDVILLDIRMPEVTGRDILGWMKKEKITTPVIVVTAVSLATDVRLELEGKYRIAGFVSKMYMSKDLLTEIERVLAKKKKMADGHGI